MYSFKQITGCALGVMLCLSTPTVFSVDIEILPLESTAQLRTRGVGIQDFIVDDTAEFKIPQFVMGDVADMHVLFKASNWRFTGSFATEGFDYFPGQGNDIDESYISYNFTQ